MARIANHQGFDLPKVDTMAEIGKTGDTSRAYEAGSVIGGYLEEFGINLDFAPDADVLTNRTIPLCWTAPLVRIRFW